MKIGLISVDNGAHIKKWGAHIYPNIALAKIARYHRLHNDHVGWVNAFEYYDIIYMSKIFNFTPDDLTAYNAGQIFKGGTGYDIHSQLPEQIDLLQPDYSIYPNIPNNYAYGFLTRGCPNKCPWCVVPNKEGRIRPYMDVCDIAIEHRNHLVLMDNNILAAGEYAHEQLDKIIHYKYRIDFNQALDARLVTPSFAKQLASITWLDHRRIRFGCDTPHQIQQCEQAIDLINSYGFKGEFFLYTMLTSDFDESFTRVNHWWKRLHNVRKTHQGNQIYAHAQAYRDPYNSHHTIPQWQSDMMQWVNKKAHFVAHSFEQFRPRKDFCCSSYFK